jgi:hypothetical protein
MESSFACHLTGIGTKSITVGELLRLREPGKVDDFSVVSTGSMERHKDSIN